MVIGQFLSMYPFNEPGLHTISRGIISVYGGFPILVMGGALVLYQALLDYLFTDQPGIVAQV